MLRALARAHGHRIHKYCKMANHHGSFCSRHVSHNADKVVIKPEALAKAQRAQRKPGQININQSGLIVDHRHQVVLSNLTTTLACFAPLREHFWYGGYRNCNMTRHCCSFCSRLRLAMAGLVDGSRVYLMVENFLSSVGSTCFLYSCSARAPLK